MVEKINNEMIIYYKDTNYNNIYKRVISKLDNEKFNITTYYVKNLIIKALSSKIEFTEEEIEVLIDVYLKEFNIKKTIEYK